MRRQSSTDQRGQGDIHSDASSDADENESSKNVRSSSSVYGRSSGGADPFVNMPEAIDKEVPAVPIETLMKMPEHERHLHVQTRFDAIKHNRRLREEGRDDNGYALRQFTSNFKQLMRTLEASDGGKVAKGVGGVGATRRGLKPQNKGSNEGGGADPSGGGGGSVGPLMAEIKRLEEEETAKKKDKIRAAIQTAQRHARGGGDEDTVVDGHEGGGAGGATTTQSVLDFIDEEDIERAINMTEDMRALSRTAVATAHKQRDLDDMEERAEYIRSLNKMFETHMLVTLPKLKRSRSSPGAYKSTAMFDHVSQKVREQSDAIDLLKKQLDGSAPRPVEKQLDKQIHYLEDQISNQISLIRGLREKLRILREQHKHCLLSQRSIQKMMQTAYSNGFVDGQQMKGGGGGILPPLSSRGAPRIASPRGVTTTNLVRPPSTPAGNSSNGKEPSSGSPAHTPRNPPSSPQQQTSQSAATPTPFATRAKPLSDGRAQTVDDAGNPLPQGRMTAAVVIIVQSIPHLLQTMPEVLMPSRITLREVLKPTSDGTSAPHLYPQAANNNPPNGMMMGDMPFSRSGKGRPRGLQPMLLATGGAGQHTAAAGNPNAAGIDARHPFHSCRAIEAARLVHDGCERYVFIFPSATDAVKYCLLTQQRLLDASWPSALGDEFETGVELVQGTTSEYVWRGLRVSMGVETGAVIRPDALLHEKSIPVPGGGGGGGAGAKIGSNSPSSPALVLANNSLSYEGIGINSETNNNNAFNEDDGPMDEDEAQGLAMAEALFAANCPAVTVPYEGLCLDTASYMSAVAVGGEVLLTKSVADAVDVDIVTEALQGYFTYKYTVALGAKECPFGHLAPVLRYWGDFSQHFSHASVFRIIGPTLLAREGAFRRDMASAERAYQAYLTASARGPFDDVSAPNIGLSTRPIGLLGVVLSDWIASTSGLPSAVVTTAKAMVFGAVREVAVACRGYVCKVINDCEGYVLCFDEAVNAASFGLKIHDHLMGLEWPLALLRVPQCAKVEVDGKLLFRGPRVQCGMVVCTPGKRTTGMSVLTMYQDALTQRTLYAGGGTELVSLFTQHAVGGELLVPADVLTLLTKYHEFLGFETHRHCLDISTATSDALIGLYQVFTRKRTLCASYVNRESRLTNESDAAIDNKLVKTYEDQIATLKEKLFNKDQSIKRLDTLIGEKNNVIAEIRSEVMKHAHYKYNYSDTLGKIAIGSFRQNFDSVLVGISFTNAAPLFKKLPLDTAQAVKIYGVLLDRCANDCKGKLVCQLPSGIARIYMFSEPVKAIDFWFKVFERALDAEWPLKLEESIEAATVRAVDLDENLHPNLDQLIWKGLRPCAVMEYGLPSYQFDSVAKAYAPYGPPIDFIGNMLKLAGDGDCIVSFKCTIALQKAMTLRSSTARLQPYGPDGCERLTSPEWRMRLKVLRPVFPTEAKQLTSPSTAGKTIYKALSVYVGIADVPSLTCEDQFPADLLTYRRCVEGLILEYKGLLVATDGKGHSFSLIFEDLDDGIDFISAIHRVLMHCTWTSALLREEEFSDRVFEDRQITGGIGAKVGAHLLHNVHVSVQSFGGTMLYQHKEMSFAGVLSHHAHNGESLATEEVFTELMQSTRERSAKIYPDLIGALTGVEEVRSHPVHVYQILPMELHFRSSVFLEEDRIANDPQEKLRRKQKSKKVSNKRKQYFDGYKKDEAMLLSCERTLNPVDDPVRLNQRLYGHLRDMLDADRQRFITTQRTLQMLESINMLSEDRASLPITVRGYPFHVHLVLYMMENSAMCQDHLFDKKYAVDLLRADWEEAEEGAESEGRDIGALMSHLGGGGGGAHHRHSTRGSVHRSNRLGGGGAANDGEGDGSDEEAQQETFKSRMQHMQGQQVLPEDFVQLHVDIERFANIIELNGLTKEAGRQWVAGFPDLCVGVANNNNTDDSMDNRGGASVDRGRERSSVSSVVAVSPQQSVNAKQLRLLSSLRTSVGMQIDAIDTERVRNSVIANLSHVLHLLLYAIPGAGEEGDEFSAIGGAGN